MKRGRGIAFALKACVSPTTSVAIVNVSADGSPTLYISTVDMGQGSDTGMAQIVGEVLNVPAESVRVVARDTDVTPYDMGTLGSRSMFHMGHAVRLAAEEARQKIDELRREVGEPEGSNTPVSGLFIKKYGMKAGNIVGSGSYQPGTRRAGSRHRSVARNHAVLDGGRYRRRDRGRHRDRARAHLAKLINAVDCGTQGQSAHRRDADFRRRADAARLHHVGEDEFDGGQVTNASLADYKITGIGDLPDVMINEAIDAYQHNAPFGAKGVGESSTMPVSPAIANAIDDAVGVRLTALPLTPEAVFRALREKEGRPLADA